MASSKSNPMKRIFSIRDFSLLFSGQTTSMLGDQCYSIAAAWLVLNLTGDPLALGIVIAVASIPRAIFTLIGGAISDRFSPRKVMLLSDIIRLALTATMAVQVFTGTLPVWMIYLYSLLFGAVGGVFSPASMAMTPNLVPSQDLAAGNSIMQGSSQLVEFVGPAAAGAFIAIFPHQNAGVGWAIAFDALTFIVSVVTLWMMQAKRIEQAPNQSTPRLGMIASIREGMQYMFGKPMLRSMFILLSIANFAFAGPIIVGIPYLAKIRFPEGAAAYGLIISGYAGGNLIGILVSGILPKLKEKQLSFLFYSTFLIFAVGVTSLAWVSNTWVAFGIMAITGVFNGYLAILLLTNLQRSTPRAMLGRLMSLIILSNLIFMPLSQTISGAVLRWSIPALYIGAGILMLFCLGYLFFPQVGALMVRQMAQEETTSLGSPSPAE